MEEIAQVYSRSLFDVAREHGKLDVVHDQLAEFADAVSENPGMATFFFSPYFSTEEKKEGLNRAVEGADETVLNFLELLLEKHRMPVIFRVRRRFEELYREENKLLPVALTSAIELDESAVKRVGDAIGERTGRRIELTANVDPDILGGIVLRVGNSVLDASIRHRLEQLRKQVAKT